MCAIPVVSADVEHDLIDQILFGVPDSALDHVPGEDIEPDLDLVEPRQGQV